MKRVSYSLETKYKTIEMTIKRYHTKEIMDKLHIHNRT